MAEEAATAADAAGHAAVNRAVVLHGLDSEELAWRAKQGCQASFTELVHRYAPRLHMFLRRRARASHEVEDLVQDTFVKAYQNLDHYDRTWKFSTWLFTIATRLAVSHHRKRQPTGRRRDFTIAIALRLVVTIRRSPCYPCPSSCLL